MYIIALLTVALGTVLPTCAPPSTCPKLRFLSTTLSWCFSIHISYVARVFKVKENDSDVSLVIGCLVLLLWLPLHHIAEYPAKIYFSKFYSATHIKELYSGVFKVADFDSEVCLLVAVAVLLLQQKSLGFYSSEVRNFRITE